MTFLGKGLQQYNTTTKQQTQDYEMTRRCYATRRIKIFLRMLFSFMSCKGFVVENNFLQFAQ